jgi:hypothetical protein
MEADSQVLTNLAGLPLMAGLLLAAAIAFLTSDWRLSLTALLLQYLLVSAALASAIRAEVAIVKILVGVLVVSILYLTARRTQDVRRPFEPARADVRVLGMEFRLGAGPLGLPVRFLVVILAVLAVLRLFEGYDLPFIDTATALAATWLALLGLIGLILSDNPLRTATALFTILAGFDLVYAQLETSLAVVGFWGALLILTALGFAYLAIAQALGGPPNGSLLRQWVSPAQEDPLLEGAPASTPDDLEQGS